MRKEDYNNKILREYLLGLLPETETERLDELSVTEDQFAQNLIIAEHDLIDAYVNGELTEKELPQFRNQYSRSPHQIERVRFAQAFQLINKTRDEAEVTRSDDIENISTTSTSSFFNFSNWITFKWGLATSSLLLFAIASWFVVQQLRQRPSQTSVQAPADISDPRRQVSNDQDHRLQEQPTPTSGAKTEQERLTQLPTTQPENRPSPSRAVAFVLRPQMRSVSQPPELSLTDDTTILALTLQLEFGETNDYRTILTEASSDRPIWQSGRIKRSTTNEGSVLYIRVPASLLRQKVYKIRAVGIYPNGTTETTSEYFFRVVK